MHVTSIKAQWYLQALKVDFPRTVQLLLYVGWNMHQLRVWDSPQVFELRQSLTTYCNRYTWLYKQ